MLLETLIGELEFVLLESAGRFNIDMDKYEKELKYRIDDLYESSLKRYGLEDTFDPKKEFIRLRGQTLKNMHKLGSGLARILGKMEVDVSLTVVPQVRYYYGEENYFEPATHAYVKVHRSAKPVRNVPGFTYFGPREVDDVLDVGDTDFFHDQDVEVAYFQLVNEIRNPGSARKSGKAVRVYTARPKKDRPIYDGAKWVPSGIFVTNSADRAEGFGSDFGGTQGRDLWRITIDSKHLVQTLKAGRVRDFQVVGRGKVPIKSIELL